MKLHASSGPSSKLLAAFFAASSVILGSCGGGGGSNNNNFDGGDVRVLPNPGTFYAGVPSTITFVGGRRPYAIASSDPTVLQVPPTINQSFLEVIPNNPGVVDPGLQPGEVPRRTLRVSMRDQNGRFNDAEIAVLQNFLTGYGLIFTSECAPATAGGTAPQACVGGESIVTAVAVTNGTLFGNRVFRFEVIRGPFQFVSPEVPTNVPPVLLNTYTTNTDHTGAAIARIRVTTTATPSLATIRLIDVATGVYADTVFLISQGPPVGTITLIPNTLTFTGNLTTDCGGGSSDILIQGGSGPYTIIPPQNIFANPTTVQTGNPTRFNLTVPAQVAPCQAIPPIIVQDSQGRQAQLTVTSAPGTTTLPPLAVSPASVDMGGICGFSASVSVVGGAGGPSTSSTHPRVTAGAGGSTISIVRALNGDGVTVYPTTGTISVTDGFSLASISVTNIAPNCP